MNVLRWLWSHKEPCGSLLDDPGVTSALVDYASSARQERQAARDLRAASVTQTMVSTTTRLSMAQLVRQQRARIDDL